jgi:di/tricarboxylate transporter
LLANFDSARIALLAILLIAFVLLITERIRIDLTAILIVVALAATRLLKPEEALSGFGSEPAIIVAAVFVLSGGLYRTGTSERLGNWITRIARKGSAGTIGVLMPAVAFLSAFTHHVTVTAVMLPVTLKMGREQGISPSKLLMPLSFAASLGTTITIIGAPAFLIADGILRQSGRPGLGIFSIAPIGLALTLLGTFYTLILGRYLLPEYQGGDEADEWSRLDGYYTELVVLPDSSLAHKTIEEIERRYENQLRVVNWLRKGRSQDRPYGKKQVKEDDVLLVQTTPEEIATVESEPGIAFNPLRFQNDEFPAANENEEEASERLVQAVVAPGSELVGRTIEKADLPRRFGVTAVGIWRQKGWVRTELARIRLREGDVLVLLGDREAFNRVARDQSFLMLVPFKGEARLRYKGSLAAGIMMASILIVSFNLLPVEIGLLAGAAIMVLSGCITARQAYQSIDVRIYIFIAGAIPLGLAMQESGTSNYLAGWLKQAIGGWSPFLILFVLFIFTGLITQVMSDAATTALLAPVALVLARTLGQAPEAYVVTVAMASVASFYTPIGHHGNLLVYGPGRYKFTDFLRMGTPLTLMAAAIVVSLALLLWPK